MARDNDPLFDLESIKVLSVDPGGTTGLAYATIQVLHKRLDFHAAAGVKLTSGDLYLVCGCLSPDVIVSEDFQYRADGQGTVLVSRNLIGVCEAYCQQKDIPFVLQQPGQAKPAFPDNVLKANSMYTKGSDHARDATRHMLFYALRGKGAKYIFERGTGTTIKNKVRT